MFDRITIQPQVDQHHHHRTEVHEHRAPTDKSVQLLKEMEAAALDKLLSSVRLENCPVSGVIHMMQDALGLSRKFIIEYKIGSRTERIDHTININLSLSQVEAVAAVANELRDVLANHIAKNILAGCFPAIMKNFRGF